MRGFTASWQRAQMEQRLGCIPLARPVALHLPTSPTSKSFHHLPRQCYLVGTKCSNTHSVQCASDSNHSIGNGYCRGSHVVQLIGIKGSRDLCRRCSREQSCREPGPPASSDLQLLLLPPPRSSRQLSWRGAGKTGVSYTSHCMLLGKGRDDGLIAR